MGPIGCPDNDQVGDGFHAAMAFCQSILVLELGNGDVRHGPKGGRHTEQVTKDGRQYHHYF